jgi:hypothetical protein
MDLLGRLYSIRRSNLYNPGTKSFNPRGVSLYLKREEQLRDLLLGLIYVTGGQAPRATELISIWYKNGEATERGVYVHEGSIIYITRYNKAKRSTNKEFVVVRFLPYHVGRLLYKYLVFIRPVADLLRQEQVRTLSLPPGSYQLSGLLFYTGITKKPSDQQSSTCLTTVLKRATMAI